MSHFLWGDGPSPVRRGAKVPEIEIFNLPWGSTTKVRFLANPVLAMIHYSLSQERSIGCQETKPGACPFRKAGKHLASRPCWYGAVQLGSPARDERRKSMAEARREREEGKGHGQKLNWQDRVLAIPRHFYEQLPDGDLRGVILNVARAKSGKRSIRVESMDDGQDTPDFDAPAFDVQPILERIWGFDPDGQPRNVFTADNSRRRMEEETGVQPATNDDLRAELDKLARQNRKLQKQLRAALGVHPNGTTNGHAHAAAEGGAA
jgi:hypothetical protein